MPQTFAAPRWRVDLTRTALSGIGGVVGLAAAGWVSAAVVTAIAATLGAFLGFLLALGLEYLSNQRGELVRLQGIERQAAAECEQAEAIKRQLEWQLAVAHRETAIKAVYSNVWHGAFLEVEGVKRIPFDAIMARIEVESIAAGLNVPLERPEA